ncbi:MAG: molybdenum ABC transporter ATP-binding protein [Solirubrobacterales bacterium]
MLEVDARRRLGDFSVDARLSAGKGVTALFGRSGSGKSTIVNMVAGLLRPDAGRIAVDGKMLFDAAIGMDLPPERRRVGYVFQDARLFPHLSVRSNLCFGLNRVPRAERRIEPGPVIDLLGIGHLLDRRPAGLSGGERQRVAIGRALLANPRILLMDEPLAALDPQRKAEVLPFLAGLARRFDIPVLYVSHSMDEVLALADTLALVDDGRIAATGAVEDLLARPELRPLTGRYEAGAVLRAVVAGHDPELGISRLAFRGGTLVAALTGLPVGTVVRVRVHARDVAIALDRPERVSIRNVLPAVVRTVTANDQHQVDVTLDCGGTLLWAQITAHGQADLDLKPGMAVHALVKAVTLSRTDVAAAPGPAYPDPAQT